MLRDLLTLQLKLVICGSAAGKVSAEKGQYYAGPGNRFWKTLAETKLTPRELKPSEYADLLSFGIGLTDMVKGQSGADSDIDFKQSSPEVLNKKILEYQPVVLAFNGKKSACVYFKRAKVNYGLQPDLIGQTQLFVLPSTSGLAIRYWDPDIWCDLARIVKSRP